MTNIQFNKFYKIFNVLSLSLILISLFLLVIKGLNYGVDFKGGTLIELRTSEENSNISKIRDSFNQMNFYLIYYKCKKLYYFLFKQIFLT